MNNTYGIIANYDGDSYVNGGAKCYLLFLNPGNGSDRVNVSVVSKGGRRITRFVDTKKLYNFRRSYWPPYLSEYPTYREEKAQQLAERLAKRYDKQYNYLHGNVYYTKES